MSKKGRTVKFEVCIQVLPLPSHPGPVHRPAEISEKMHNTRTLIPPVPCISQILTTINLYSGKARMGL